MIICIFIYIYILGVFPYDLSLHSEHISNDIEEHSRQIGLPQHNSSGFNGNNALPIPFPFWLTPGVS